VRAKAIAGVDHVPRPRRCEASPNALPGSVMSVSLAELSKVDSHFHVDSEIHVTQFTFGSRLRIAWQESRGFSMVVTGIGRKPSDARLHNVILHA
jgi:hypothetical protein